MPYANHLNYTDNKGYVFCRKRLKLVSINKLDCNCCKMFYGSLQGDGVECYWDDPRITADDMGLWYVKDHNKELKSVKETLKHTDNPKSINHSRITGEFSEHLVLYWLSRCGYEAMKVDHVAVDLIARNTITNQVLGISIKSRSRLIGQEKKSPHVKRVHLETLNDVCKRFNWLPRIAIVIDMDQKTYIFFMDADELLSKSKSEKTITFSMSEKAIEAYKSNPNITTIEFEHDSWLKYHI